MRSNGHHNTFAAKLRRFYHLHVRHTPRRIAETLRGRGKELNTMILRKRTERAARKVVGDGDVRVPERWFDISYDELLSYHMRSNDPRTADTLPDSAWGVLDEAARCFARNGHKLLDSDFEHLRTLARSDENIHTMSIAELCKRQQERSAATGAVQLRTKRLKGERS